MATPVPTTTLDTTHWMVRAIAKKFDLSDRMLQAFPRVKGVGDGDWTRGSTLQALIRRGLMVEENYRFELTPLGEEIRAALNREEGHKDVCGYCNEWVRYEAPWPGEWPCCPRCQGV